MYNLITKMRKRLHASCTTSSDTRRVAGPSMGLNNQYPAGPGDRLDSWKAIADHLGREVRTIQRWERDRGLPVHRVPGDRGGVFAYTAELDRWLHGHPFDPPPAQIIPHPIPSSAA